MFVNEIALAGLAEVELGKLAEERGNRDEVKQYGRMMVQDHTRANAELMKVAAQMNVQIPAGLDQKHRAMADQLRKLKGEEFDREYMRMMVDSHQQVRNRLQTRTGATTQTTRTGGGAAAPTSTLGGGGDASQRGGGNTAGATEGSRPGAGGAATQPSGSQARGADAGGSAARGTSGPAGGNSQLDAWAKKTLPAVEQHLKQAQQIQQKLGGGGGASAR